MNRLTGDESMWGVIGKPSEAILNLVNASPLMVSELIDYQEAVNSHMALPFGNLKEWSGATMLAFPRDLKQIVISSDVVAVSPAETVGDLSYGLGFFRDYDDDRQLIETSISKLSPSDPKYRIVSALAGVTIVSRAEVNNYVIQQQIIAKTGATTKQPVTIKLENDQNAKGMLQFALDNAYAADRAIGMPPDTIKLEQAAYGVTKLIPIPNFSAR
ncbi:hypothetical protein [Paraburkholderia flava]|uniref:hypothetical protein n=1 Tax=Paraburkholderia flava TaxID=2547393 RepID=UPI00105CEB41|nr:hypothetical protein [Paraburkholderia flava]